MHYPPHQELEQYRPLIEAALAHTGGECTWDYVREEVQAGRAFLMVHPSGKSVAVLQPVRDLHVFTASGDLGELMDMEADAAARAKASGFDRMTMIGREGWKRALKMRGWKPEAGLVKEL
jgi:hypothetical protein